VFANITSTISRAIQNRMLARQGVGCCRHCKNHWGVVEGAYIPFASNRSMFPICKNCFALLDADTIIGYCNELVNTWLSQHPVEDEQEIREAAAHSVREMKHLVH
jgi:hypothetical protein